MGGGHRTQLLGGLRQRDVKPGLTAARPLQQKLQRKRGFAGAGRALNQVKPMRRQATAQDVVKARDAGRGSRRRDR